VNLPLIVNPEAEADLADARAWYEGQRAGLGDVFLDRVAAVYAAEALTSAFGERRFTVSQLITEQRIAPEQEHYLGRVLAFAQQAGMAVPDGPNIYGYNMFRCRRRLWIGGIIYEHTHRLRAAVDGFLSILL